MGRHQYVSCHNLLHLLCGTCIEIVSKNSACYGILAQASNHCHVSIHVVIIRIQSTKTRMHRNKVQWLTEAANRNCMLVTWPGTANTKHNQTHVHSQLRSRVHSPFGEAIVCWLKRQNNNCFEHKTDWPVVSNSPKAYGSSPTNTISVVLCWNTYSIKDTVSHYTCKYTHTYVSGSKDLYQPHPSFIPTL